MSNVMAKMHQIRFRLGLRPRLHRGSLQRSLDSLSGFKGVLVLRIGGREGEGKGGSEGRVKEREGSRRRKGEKGSPLK